MKLLTGRQLRGIYYPQTENVFICPAISRSRISNKNLLQLSIIAVLNESYSTTIPNCAKSDVKCPNTLLLSCFVQWKQCNEIALQPAAQNWSENWERDESINLWIVCRMLNDRTPNCFYLSVAFNLFFWQIPQPEGELNPLQEKNLKGKPSISLVWFGTNCINHSFLSGITPRFDANALFGQLSDVI